MPEISRSWSQRGQWAVALALTAALVLRSWFFLAWNEAYFDSDQAIVGLMAKHITEGRALPLFFYGQEYMLAVEAWVMAPVFLILGPSVFALHLTMLLFNVAAGLLLWRLLVRDAALRPAIAALAVLPFCLAPVVLSAHLIEAQGGNPEPFLWVGVLWLVRRRPLWLGALGAVAFLHREFSIYAIPALVAVTAIERLREDHTRAAWLLDLRRWMVTAFAGAVVFFAIQALTPLSDVMGPGTAGARPPDRPQDNITQLINRIEWEPEAVPRRIEALPTQLFPLLLGVASSNPRSFSIGSRVRVGWPEFLPLVTIAALLLPIGLLARRGRGVWHRDIGVRRSFRDVTDHVAGSAANSDVTVPDPAPAATGFPLYLLLIGAQSALVYIVTRNPSAQQLRYALLALLVPIGLSALLLQPWRPLSARVATGVLLGLLAAAAAVDHVRVIAASYQGPPPLRFADAAGRLMSRGVAVGRAGYWRAYAITFLTREAVRLTSTEVMRIQEYEDLADAAEPDVLRVQEASCDPGVPEDRVGAWYLCGP